MTAATRRVFQLPSNGLFSRLQFFSHALGTCCGLVANRCDPVPVVLNAVANSSLAVRDSVVEYQCLDGFISSQHPDAISVFCNGQSWSKTTAQLPQCRSKHGLNASIFTAPRWFVILIVFVCSRLTFRIHRLGYCENAVVVWSCLPDIYNAEKSPDRTVEVLERQH